MESEYVFLAEKPEMWARMLTEILSDNGIPCVTEPVRGAALVLQAGVPEDLRIYVPGVLLEQAEALMQALFSEEESTPI